MRLFNFIEQNDRIWFSADFFGQLAALVVSDVAGRRADQLGNAVFFHILGHVNSNHGIFVSEHDSCQRFGEFRLAHAGRA